MKYKDFKTMSQNEMKAIKGGYAPVEGGDDGGGCTTKCTKTSGNTIYVYSCNATVLGCSCSQSGASECKTL